MIEMFLDIQREILDRIQEQNPEDHQYSANLHLIRQEIVGEETEEAKKTRLEAEARVMEVVLQHGEEIGHGDLLTFQKVQQAILLSGQASETSRDPFSGIESVGVRVSCACHGLLRELNPGPLAP